MNSHLMNRCSNRSIAYIAHSRSIQENYLSESKVHLNKCDALRDLVTFAQFKKCEKKTMEEC